jgi:hypothetical protein
MPVVVCQRWVAFLALGSSTIKTEVSHGYSLHLTICHRDKYIATNYPRVIFGCEEEYPKPHLDPYFCRINDGFFDMLKLDELGSLRFYIGDDPEEVFD